MRLVVLRDWEKYILEKVLAYRRALLLLLCLGEKAVDEVCFLEAADAV